MSILEILRFLTGLGLLLVGAEALVRGASRLAAAVRISPLVIGLTVVAFGTSSPELAASLASVHAGSGDLALGNVVGSNIFNVLFILGLAAFLSPLTVDRKLVRLDVPVMIGVAVLPLALGADGSIGPLEGALLTALLAPYLGFLLWEARREGVAAGSEIDPPDASLVRSALLALLGLAMLTLGAGWLVDGATSLARDLGIGELLIGLTLVSAGTSLPEVATSVVAALRGQRDLAVGNVVGSNIFNLLAVLGLSAAFSDSGVPVSASAFRFDLPVQLAAGFACLPVFLTRFRIDRWEGGLFLLTYAVYLLQLFRAAGKAASPSPLPLITMLLAGVLLLTVIQGRSSHSASQADERRP